MFHFCHVLQELPEAWNNVKKQSVVMKQNVAPLQAEECNKLRRKLATFDVRQHEFRENFRKTAPFQFTIDHPYVRIDRVGAVNALDYIVQVHVLVCDSFMVCICS